MNPEELHALLDALAAAEQERWITCGYNYPDEAVQARFEEQRKVLGFAIGLGCGKKIDWKFSYRCVECGRFLCQECILKHFADNGDPLASALAAVTQERDAYKMANELNAAECSHWAAECAAYLEKLAERTDQRDDARAQIAAWSAVATALGVSGPEEALRLVQRLRRYYEEGEDEADYERIVRKVKQEGERG